jgi:ribonuclease VapC
MVIDSSAIIAILLEEPEAEAFATALEATANLRMSAASYLETAVVVDSRNNPRVGRELDTFLRRSDVEILPVTHEQAQIARQAYRDFGKGQHPAGLNFGDCFAYAAAKALDEPLLFKGDDFSRTDVRRAL